MNINELSSFGEEIKTASLGRLISRSRRIPGLFKRFMRRKTKNQREAASSLLTTGLVVGGLGVGGAAYGGITQPSSIRPSNTGRYPY